MEHITLYSKLNIIMNPNIFARVLKVFIMLSFSVSKNVYFSLFLSLFLLKVFKKSFSSCIIFLLEYRLEYIKPIKSDESM